MLERALAINERAYGRDHVQVAITLVNLGVAYQFRCMLGDSSKAPEMPGARARANRQASSGRQGLSMKRYHAGEPRGR